MQTPTLRQHIEYHNSLLPYSYSKIEMRQGKPDVLFHWHPECEFIFVEKGSARFHIDNHIFYSNAGDIILIHPNALHSIHPIDDKTPHIYQSFNVHLDLIGLSIDDYSGIRYLKTLQNSLTEFIVHIRPTHPAYVKLYETLHKIFSCIEHKQPFHSLLLKSLVNELFYYIYASSLTRTRSEHPNAYRREEKIRLVIDYINKHYSEEITVNTLANVCGYSQSHFMNFFKQNVGVSSIDYLMQTRLKHVATRLKEGNEPILTIATDCGFANLAHFNRQFKKLYNCSPRLYRQLHHQTTRVLD